MMNIQHKQINSSKNKNLEIVFWNARSISNKTEELNKMVENLDIFICVESWLNERKKRFHVPGFKTFRKDRIHADGGGILILMRNNLAYTEISHLRSPDPSVEIAGISITNVEPKLDIVVCYRPKSSLTQDQWNVIFNNIEGNSKTLLVGDFNAHHVSWNCQQTDADGAKLKQSIDQSDLVLLNPHTLTHYCSAHQKHSNIDLFFSTPGLADKINLTVEQALRGSDHYAVHFSINAEKYIYRKKSFNIKSCKTNWLLVNKELENSKSKLFSEEYDSSNASEKYRIFTQIVTNAIKRHTPAKKIVGDKTHRNPVPWWDIECDRMLRLRKAAYKNTYLQVILGTG